jgi:hypothetical protein
MDVDVFLYIAYEAGYAADLLLPLAPIGKHPA